MKADTATRSGTGEANKPGQGEHDGLVREHVLSSLGVPPGLQLVQVRPLWGAYCRVNIYVGKDLVSATVADSFFVRVDGCGRVLTTEPAISRRY